MISDKEYKKLLKQFHKLSDRHILVVETDMPSSDVQKVVILSDKIRKAGNELVGLMRKNYDQLMRTKKYRKLLKLYGSTNDKKKHRDLANQLNEMQKQYNVTWDHCRNAMIHIGKKYSIDAVFALTKAEDIWRGIEKCLYNNGKTIHFSKYGELPCIRAKQINRGISMSVKDNELKFKLKGNVFGIQVKDRFQTDEVCAVLEYLSRSEIINDKAINKFLDKAYIVLKCSGKSYTTTASVSGYWKIDTKKPLGRNRIEMKVYKKGKVIAKYWKEYQKESSVTDKNDDQNNAASAVHKHLYNIPVYKTVHFDETGHYETIISSGSYYEKEVSHDICDTCVKDLTQEYINGIKDGTYKKVEIPKNDENTSSSKSRDILDDYKEIRWSNDMPLYEDFIAYGGWNHTCSDHKLTEQTETIMAYFPGAIRKDWIVDQKAHDEQVVIGYQCSCGDIHKVENN